MANIPVGPGPVREEISKVGITVLSPVLDDWDAAQQILHRIDSVAEKVECQVSVLLIDDGSRRVPDGFLGCDHLRFIRNVEILHLVISGR